MDSTFIRSMNGCLDAKYNTQCRNQKGNGCECIKINTLVGTYGIPISITTHSGEIHDSKLYEPTINRLRDFASLSNYVAIIILMK